MESPEPSAGARDPAAANSRKRLGRHAERLALEWLLRHGLELITQNFSCRYGELDLVMREQNCIVFVEVRSRGQKALVPAAQTVDRRKQRRLCRAALVFLARHPEYDAFGSRFDVLGIDRTREHPLAVNWVRDAFRPMMDDQG